MAIKSTGGAGLLLERIVSEERGRSTLILCWLRVLLASFLPMTWARETHCGEDLIAVVASIARSE